MNKSSFKFPWFATLFTLIAFLILIGLGSWQIHRLSWKTNLIEALDKEFKKDAHDYPLIAIDLRDVSKDHPIKGSITGKFNYDQEIKVGPRNENGVLGYDIYTPFTLQTGGTILVDRGWIETAKSEQKDRPETLIIGKQVLTGMARLPSQPWSFGPGNIPKDDIWIYVDIQEIAAAKNIDDMVPAVFHLESSNKSAHDLLVTNERWQPRNKHLQYALFWFSMAGVLVLIYGVRFFRK